MRRVVLAVAVCVGVQLILPPPAEAWFGWWDELSGAGDFTGIVIDARLYCFGVKPSPIPSLLKGAHNQLNFAYELVKADPEVSRELVRELSDKVASSMAVSARTLSLDRVSTLATELGTLAKTLSASREKSTAALAVREAADAYDRVVKEVKNDTALTSAAGVSLSACPMRRDVNRRGSIDVSYRWMRTWGEGEAQFAGGNEIRLVTVTPTVTWRPLFDVANGKYDYVDIGTGVGVYWLSSEEHKSGGFNSFNGIVFEPVRLDFHAPTIPGKSGVRWGLLAAVSGRFGWAIFPAGFKNSAFGTTLEAEKAQRIPAEWVPNAAIYFDVGRFIYYASHANQY
jgi:hypothetical protein